MDYGVDKKPLDFAGRLIYPKDGGNLAVD